MKAKYEEPKMEKVVVNDTNVILTSAGAKNPGNHPNCTVMPNGNPLPPNANMNHC